MPPSTPKGLSPNADSDPVSTTGTVFRATAFQDPDARDGRNFAHESHWQVAREIKLKTFRSPFRRRGGYRNLWRSPDKEATWYSVDTVEDPDVTKTTFDERLPAEQQLFWRVRYRDENLAWSPWSTPIPFTTGSGLNPPEQTNASLNSIFAQWGASL